MILETLLTSPNDSVMIPIPQYPLYSASISLNGGHMCPYYLNEEKGWQLDLEELERSIQQAKKDGKTPKAIVIINPGNPTGAIFNAETIKKIIEFSVKNKLVLISDEVIFNSYFRSIEKTSIKKELCLSQPTESSTQCLLNTRINANLSHCTLSQRVFWENVVLEAATCMFITSTLTLPPNWSRSRASTSVQTQSVN